MPDTLILLQLEHRNYGRILEHLDGLVDRLESGQEVDASKIDQIFQYFADYPDRCHHPKEDLVFHRLELRAPETAAEVGDLLGDHSQLADLTRRTCAIVEASARNGGISSPRCLAAMREFSRSYREHIQSEDELFFPRVLETLSRADLDLIDFSMFDSHDPIFDDDAEVRFQRLRNAIFEGSDPSEEKSAS
jgi:hemerythrin-like domain-containing protein